MKFVIDVNYFIFFRAVFDTQVHVVDPIGTVGLQPTGDSNDNKKVKISQNFIDCF